MIDLKYDREQNSTIISVGDLTCLGDNIPLKIELKNIITDEVHYTCNLSSNMWASWKGAELITDVLVYTNDGNLLQELKWDVWVHGDTIEKTLWYYLLNRKNLRIPSNGLVIGTHDGRNGHWIYPIKENLSRATLVDGSEKQFIKLKENYSLFTNVEMINKIVTPNGGMVTWYQGGEGYTDTVVPDLIHSWLEESKITRVTSDSISMSEMMEDKDFDWLHLDVEGIDDELIKSLKKLPNIIIYESMNLDEGRIQNLQQWFSENSYKTLEDNGNTIAIKNN